MVHLRKLALAIAAASTLASGLAQALELGEVTLKSAPGQPLAAEIELRDVGNLAAPEIVPSLASPEDFTKAGVDRQAYLGQLQFTPVINPGGRSVIQVTSPTALPDPMVKFLVQVVYPSGRLLRDYSVLVDPAKFAAPAGEPGRDTPAPAVATANRQAEHYTTKSPDTLWEIAARARPAGASVQQTMLAIQALNPDAFIDGNINRLRAGQVLRLPDAPNATALAQPRAVAEVARQNAAWHEGRRLGPRAQQVDATRRAPGSKAPAPAPGDNLSLVSGQARSRKGAAADQQAVRDQLASTQESLDSARRENAELKSRNDDLQSQLDKLQRLLQLKNDQLAKLEASAGAPQPPGTPASTGSPAIGAQLAAPAAPSEAATGQAPANAGAPPNPAPAAPPSSQGASNPAVLGAAGGIALIAVLLAAWLLARKRKADQEAEKHVRMAKALAEEGDFPPDDFDFGPDSFEGLAPQAPNVKLAPAMVAASAAAAQASASSTPLAAPVEPAPRNEVPSVASLVKAPAADDVLTQAQAAVAAGRFNQAADLLEPAVEAQPERSELRLMLMEVYANQGDRDAFVANERRLLASGANQAEVEALKSRFPAMLGALAGVGLSAAAVAAELDAQYVKDLLQDEPDGPEPIGEVFDTDFDLDLDGIDPVGAGAAAKPASEAEKAADPAKRDDVDFDALLRETEAERARDIDLSDFDLDIAADAPAPSPVDDLDDLALEALADPEKGDGLPGDFDLSTPGEASPGRDQVAAGREDVTPRLGSLSGETNEQNPAPDDFDFLADTDEVSTKLDLAKAYIEMKDADGARDILDEVLKEGTDAQQHEARRMLADLG
ncbi:FimV/HubP family polar landmark protein [Pseudomonas typographi]|uniref:FimV/HubP family polar landmark protein n=1 Tax=Pseudomonas typographi TaxID=2715964 RepID=UPI0016854803|nr:FimV/HubP family polar landmark protein [Pseudomonas typographi]MBD1588861.1 FimV family protein [Pseudomonas typographi]